MKRNCLLLFPTAIALRLEACQALSVRADSRATRSTPLSHQQERTTSRDTTFHPHYPHRHFRRLRPEMRQGNRTTKEKFYPDGVPPPFYSGDTYERYIRLHQSVRKRRSIRRLYDIAVILLGQVLRPLVCSLSTTGKQVEDWEAFWTRKSKRRQTISNAQRLAQGFQSLGPTYVKMAQAVASRPDLLQHIHPSIKPPLTDALTNLHDNMLPFDDRTAKRIVRQDLIEKANANKTVKDYSIATRKALLESFSNTAAAAASVAQVYKAYLRGYGYVAVKVQRPGIRRKVERDATLFHSLATWFESASRWRPALSFTAEDGFQIKLATAQKQKKKGDSSASSHSFGSGSTSSLRKPIGLVRVVDEFTERVLEDMDFRREVANMQAFAELYSRRTGVVHPDLRVVVPEVIPELCSDRVIVMEWIEGKKLTDMCGDCDEKQEIIAENLALVEKAIECTLSQLLDSGVLHADPHTGNLLKVELENGEIDLGYLDFGLVSFVPQSVRDGIVCAVVQIVFARNIAAVADLCTDLELLPKESLDDPEERKRLIEGLQKTFNGVLVWPRDNKGRSNDIPRLRFEMLPDALADLITSFNFSIPPYFLNNMRCLATLEGIALKLDPQFNILRVVYPYSINRLMRNPAISAVVEQNFMDICQSPETRLFDPKRVMMLLNDWALFTGYRKRKIFWDLASSTGGRRVGRRIVGEWFKKYYGRLRRRVLGVFSLAG